MLILIVLALAGCSTSASTDKTVTTIGYGTVTEITQTPCLKNRVPSVPGSIGYNRLDHQGTIGEVLVSVGQEVRANDILMTLDQASLPENTKLAQLRMLR